MNESGTEGVLLDQETLRGRLGDAPDRIRAHYRLFREDDGASPDTGSLRPTRERPKAPEALLERGAWRRFADRRALGTGSPAVTAGLGDD